MHNKEVQKARDRLEHVQQITSYLIYSGLPEGLREPLIEYFKWEVSLVQPPTDIIGVEDGCLFDFDGFQLQGVLTPGHAAGHLSFLQEDEGLLFVGDTILEGVIPNPVIEPLPGQTFKRERSLEQYINSMKLITKLETTRILPGHGTPISDSGKALLRMTKHFQKRKKELSRIAACLGVFNPFELTAELYRNIQDPLDYYLAMSGVLGQLDLLEAEGKIMQLQTASSLSFTWIAS